MHRRIWDTVKDTLGVIAVSFIVSLFLRATVAEATQVPTPSMVPTIQVGDRLLTDKLFFRMYGIDRLDVVVFQPPFASEYPYVKRVIGLPGDVIEVKGGKVYVSGKPLEERYLNEKPKYSFGPFRVPDGNLFLLGDNRNNSNDSHFWGTVPISEVKGRAVMRIYPFDRVGLLER